MSFSKSHIIFRNFHRLRFAFRCGAPVLDTPNILKCCNLPHCLLQETKHNYSVISCLPAASDCVCIKDHGFSSGHAQRQSDKFQFMLMPRRCMAGHSKWQNIRHIKAAKDSERSKLISQFTNRIKRVIRETGVADPKLNSMLSRVVADAKSKNVPSSNIESAIQQASKAKDAMSQVFLEGRGPGGSWFVVEIFTDRIQQTRNELQGLVKKLGCSFGEHGCAKHAFDHKGVIEVSVSENDVDMDKYIDVAIEAGAEEVTLETGDEDQQYLRFICEPGDRFSVKKNLENGQLDVTSVCEEFIPISSVFPGEQEFALINKMMERVDDHPDVVQIYINVDPPET